MMMLPKKSAFSPVISPRVSDDPELLASFTALLAVTNDRDVVVQFCRVFRPGKNSSCKKMYKIRILGYSEVGLINSKGLNHHPYSKVVGSLSVCLSV